ncbi:expressed unknown protein [Seminavis robusta]|uniref:Uncharacterized protein n=1 Tax=Seminavis robusta TaxID=568900 RepID=A0A9N8EFC3_9STRA|nr:expressed unknown protein [Seminavis robusta]|eukprot:Sro855_g211390.1 n/a (124) ;mRNA; r:20980-21427
MQWSYLPILMELISLYTEGRLQVADVPFSIRRSYGLEGSISSPRFLRSVFVAMLRSSTLVHETVQTPQGFTGTSCVAVAQSVVKTFIVGENPCYFERLQVFLRFHSIHGTKVEMSFRSKQNHP